MKIVTAEQMRAIDRECARRGTPTSVLMENAGRAVAEATRDFLGNIRKQNILCLVGGGNNGGDALVAGRYLSEWGAQASVYICSPRPDDDENLKLLQKARINCVTIAEDISLKKYTAMLAIADCVVDGLLGTGKMRPLEGVFQSVLKKANAAREARGVKIIAVDLPSGMDADTGAIDPDCANADLTVTLAFPKPGLYQFPGAEKAGKIIIADIGIPAALADDINFELLTPEWAAGILPRRPLSANKGTFGKAIIIAGSANYVGAAYLACAGALRSGAGLVTLASVKDVRRIVAARLAEATYLPLPETKDGFIAGEAGAAVLKELPKYNVLLVGCGLAQEPPAKEFLKSLLFTKDLPAIVLDADALNIIAGVKGWAKKLPPEAVLTPHPGEMARLTGLTIEKIQADRTGTAVKYAAEWNKVVVLKGAFTVIAAPDGRRRISPYANPGLATGGTGDVLAGMIAGLAAQGLPLYDAAALGVFLHGAAGEKVKAELGDTGMTASDLLPEIPRMIKEIKNREARRYGSTSSP
jgi:ADP-dependent NAD(P)H-hydrate dehydratase / NAD(P)H-hydrate epimerase